MPPSLDTISKIAIAGTEYPVLEVREQRRVEGPADQSRISIEETVWNLRCFAPAASATTIRAFNDQIQSQLCKRGEAVTLTERGQSTTLPAAGTGGCLPGYPEVQLVATPAMSFGQWQAFDLQITARKPVGDVNGLVGHTYEIATTTNDDGSTSIRGTGEVRVAPGSNAVTWLNTNVMTPASGAAATIGNAFTKEITTNADAAWCRYSYSSEPVNAGAGSGLTSASSEDRTTVDVTGRTTRVISGYAEGPSAATWAAGKQLAEQPNLRLVRKEGPTPPSVPDGRVSFRYEYLQGVVDARFPNIYVISLSEDIAEVAGGQEIDVTPFLGSSPLRRLGREQGYVYRVSSSIEFLGGDYDDHGLVLPTGFSADDISGRPRFRKSGQGEQRRVSAEWTLVTSAPIDPLPDPRTVEAV